MPMLKERRKRNKNASQYHIARRTKKLKPKTKNELTNVDVKIINYVEDKKIKF